MRMRTPFTRGAPGARRLLLAVYLALAACGGTGSELPGDSADHRPWQGIGPDEAISIVGTEPFWGGTVTRGQLTYTTPDDPDGRSIAVSRFGGRGGLSFSGDLDGQALTLAITPGACSDGMSDRAFPYTVTMLLGSERRKGCAWTDAQPFKEVARP